MTSQEQLQAYGDWKQSSSPEALQKVMEGMGGTITGALRTYAGNDARLTTRAYIIAREALDSYDPTKQVAINTHVMNSLKRLYRVSADRKSAVHIPENVRFDSLKVRNTINEYKDAHGEEPSDLYVAQKLGVSLKRLNKAKMAVGETTDANQTSEKGDLINSAGRTEEDIWKDYVYHDLDEKSRKIFEMTTGYNGASIAKKIDIAKAINITPAAVSQRITTIQKRLGEYQALPNTGPGIV